MSRSRSLSQTRRRSGAGVRPHVRGPGRSCRACPRREPFVGRGHLFEAEHRLDKDTNPPRGKEREHLAFHEAGGHGLFLERTSPQRRAVNAPATIHELEEVDLTAGTRPDSDDAMRPPMASESRSALQIWRPDRFQDHVIGAVCGRVGRVDHGRAESLDAVTQVWGAHARHDRGACGHSELHSCTPTPPAAPFTSTRSPGRSSHWVNRASCATVNASGKPAASREVISSGTGKAVVRERSSARPALRLRPRP